VAAELAQLALDLRAVREREMRLPWRQQVHALDLVVHDNLMRNGELLDEVVDRL
jgi:hypothetical protein